MKNVMNGLSCDNSQASAQAQRLTELRFMVLDTVTYSAYTTADEKARTAASVARCQCAETLVKWYCNVLTVLSERELAPAPVAAPTAPAPAPAAPAPTAPVVYATKEQKQEIICLLNHPAVTKARKSKELVGINRLSDAQAVALIADLTALTDQPTPPRPRRKARAQVPTTPAVSFPQSLLDSRSRTHNGTFVCPTYAALPELEQACLDKLVYERLLSGQLVEAVGYGLPLTRPCKASARVFTVFVN